MTPEKIKALAEATATATATAVTNALKPMLDNVTASLQANSQAKLNELRKQAHASNPNMPLDAINKIDDESVLNALIANAKQAETINNADLTNNGKTESVSYDINSLIEGK